jgi:hypothetical protein
MHALDYYTLGAQGSIAPLGGSSSGLPEDVTCILSSSQWSSAPPRGARLRRRFDQNGRSIYYDAGRPLWGQVAALGVNLTLRIPSLPGDLRRLSALTFGRRGKLPCIATGWSTRSLLSKNRCQAVQIIATKGSRTRHNCINLIGLLAKSQMSSAVIGLASLVFDVSNVSD